MNKITGLIIFLFIIVIANAQHGSAAETVKNYSIAQKRLLLINTAEFANAITQNTQDRDSIMNIALRITGMPFLLPYNETFSGGQVTAVSKFVNSGRIDEARQNVSSIGGKLRIQELLEVALWYLHQDGAHRRDLDSASKFIQLASTESLATGNGLWQDECMLQSAELQYQRGHIEQSRQLFSQLAVTALHAGKAEVPARAYMRIADLLLPTDTFKETLYQKSLDIYRSLGLKEKQIELLWKIELCHEHSGFSLAKKDLHEIIDISNQTGFKHILYAQNRLAYVCMNTGDYINALEYARAALDNMNWSGYLEVQGTFYIRMGVSYVNFGSNDECIRWLTKALVTATTKSHLFWYKSLLILVPFLCVELNKPAQALSIIDSVSAKFPPITVWEKMQWLAVVGTCHQQLEKPQLADKCFRQLLELANANPEADPYGEMSADYIYISQSYVSRRNLVMARLFLKQSMVKERKSADVLTLRYSLFYKMDSLQGYYKSALQNHIKYKIYYDSATNIKPAEENG